MARINIYNQSTKKDGRVKIRFRLTDGRGVQLYHKSRIEAEIKDLDKFNPDGTPKKRANYNRNLAAAINDRIVLLQSVYTDAVSGGRVLDKESFEEEIDRRLNPGRYERAKGDNDLLQRFGEFIKDNKFGRSRTSDYGITLRNLKRFLAISGNDGVSIADFTPRLVCRFQDYLINEHQYAANERYAQYFADAGNGHVPARPCCQNTVQKKLKMLKAFFNYLEECDDIPVSPFRKLGRTRRSEMFKTEYNPPVALTLDEIRKIVGTKVPPDMQQTKDAFLLQCALGCRVGDFTSMDMGYVKIDAAGIPYIAYVAHKTGMRTNTPLVRFAFDIVKRTSFRFPVLRRISGESGYNAKIKELCKLCGLTRPVEVGKDGTKVLYKPLCEVVTSKTARKTNVTLCADAQVDRTFMGLHGRGSKAVNAYDAEGIERKFKVACIAFGEKPYRIDNNLNVISESD